MTGRSKDRARLGALLVLIIGAGLLGFMLIVDREVVDVGDLFLVLAAVVFTAVGALIVARSDGNRIGWVVSSTGLALLASGVLGFLADQGSVTASALGGALWFSFLFLVGLLMFWFPTGQPVSPRWRWVGWTGFLFEIVSLSAIVSEEFCVDGGDDACRVWVANPIGIPGVPNPEYGPLSGLTFAVLAVFVLLSVVSLIVRSVRARGVERLQIKWFLFAVLFVLAGILLQEALGDLVTVPETLWGLMFGLSIMTLPIAIGVAVLRYRLYEIDRIISRTVSYTVVVVVLAAIYVAAVTWLTSQLPDQSQLVVAATTLGVATLFNPLRRRVQIWWIAASTGLGMTPRR